jgi:hypothetical protein
MPFSIEWVPFEEMQFPQAVIGGMRKATLPDNRVLGGKWGGQRQRDPTEFFVLQLHVADTDPDDRLAFLMGQKLVGEAARPLEITQEHVDEAAAFLEFRWYEWLPEGPGKVFITETFTILVPPPENMDDPDGQ